ncbi:hypothetical protein MPL1032_20133 [Mesorhizobium plurifarium]|uniref:Uncharacterized protein n=1 Tax=Mesorhizobium plurifarium TaxID=69974 RepID=A0A0K2VW52_MESPL|nr:hypothetical protein MPL1032_20133 [Mesorhizobium plurifarium]
MQWPWSSPFWLICWLSKRIAETDSGDALQKFVLMHVARPKPLRTFGRHALIFLYWLPYQAAIFLPHCNGARRHGP